GDAGERQKGAPRVLRPRVDEAPSRPRDSLAPGDPPQRFVSVGEGVRGEDEEVCARSPGPNTAREVANVEAAGTRARELVAISVRRTSPEDRLSENRRLGSEPSKGKRHGADGGGDRPSSLRRRTHR